MIEKDGPCPLQTEPAFSFVMFAGLKQLFDRHELLFEILEMRLKVSGLREARELAESKTSHKLHLRVLGSAFGVFVEHCAGARVL